jgi:protoporphyrinogen/coproporphyrinogen III oxidase
VVVVGGGIAGLTAAHTLAKRGVPFILIEAGKAFGGVIRTERRDGFLLEGGPDAMLAQKPEGVALCRELGLGDRLVPTNPDPRRRAVFVLHDRRLHPLPEGMMLAVPTRILPFLQSSLFSWPGKLRMGLDLVIPGRAANGDESVGGFLRRRFGQEAVERLGEPLLAGIHAGDPERLSMRATFPRFLELEASHGSLVRGMWASQPPAADRPASAFVSLAGGLSEMVDALVKRLPADELLTERRVRGLERRGGAYRVSVGEDETIEARAVIVAAPGPKMAPVLEPLVPAASRTLGAVSFASSATVLLGFRREDVTHSLDGYGMVIPRTEGLRTTACSFFSTKFPGRAPEGHVLLRAFLGGARDPDVLALTDGALSAQVQSEMGLVLGLRGAPVMTRVFRWPAGTPQLEVGHMERMAEAEKQVAAVPGLFLTGAGIRSTGIPDVVRDATRVATRAADSLEA